MVESDVESEFSSLLIRKRECEAHELQSPAFIKIK